MAVAQAESWTIDELAQRAGCTVDTVRFYTRQGLLPSLQRRGRSVLYNASHLERLRQIQALRERHFTLAAIRVLADEGRLDLLESFFVPSEQTMSRDELVDASGLDPALVEELESIGFLPSAKDRAAGNFGATDLRALRAVSDLVARGMPQPVVVVLVRMYLQQMTNLKARLLATFMNGRQGLGPEVPAEEVDRFITIAASDIDEFIRVFDLVLQYIHRRALQTLVVDAIDIAEASQEPVDLE